MKIIGVSPDDAESHRRFREKYGLRLDLLCDPDHHVLEAYGAWGERPDRGPGVIRSTFLVDPSGRIQRTWYGVQADGHAAEVLAAPGNGPA